MKCDENNICKHAHSASHKEDNENENRCDKKYKNHDELENSKKEKTENRILDLN